MGWIQRVFGICRTQQPTHTDCWRYENGQVHLDLKQAPELAEPDGAIRLEGHGLPKRVLVVRGNDGQLRAFHNRCTHIGHRRLDPMPGELKIGCCSVGCSEFDYEGNRIAGLAKRSIELFEVQTTDDELIITLKK